MLKKRLILFALLAVLPFVLCACGNDAPSITPTPQPTAVAGDAMLPEANQALIKGISDAFSPFEALSSKACAALQSAYNASVPLQNSQKFLSAVRESESLPLTDGVYTLSFSTSGDFTYEKPYAAITYGNNVDTYTVSEEGQPTETVENVQYDPLSFVLAGEGGGEFGYATYYLLSEDGQSGEYETVSKLDNQITGFSHFEYARSGDALYFADAQLNLDASTVAPYTWVVLVGVMTQESADIFEFKQTTQTMALPATFPKVREQKTASPAALSGVYQEEQVSRLTVKDHTVVFENADGQEKASLEAK